MHYPLPEDILQIDTNKLAELLNNVSKGRYGDKRALTKANQIRESALNSFGITVGTDVFKIQIKLLLEQINLFEEHLKQIETTMIRSEESRVGKENITS